MSMTTTPISRSKLSCKNVKGKSDVKKENDPFIPQSVTDTPKSKPQQSEDGDYSPIYFPLTQDSNEEIDVLWDWHSPQTSHRKRRKQKRLIPVQSPKFPLKRHPSNNPSQNFERLRNELKALQEELAQPDDESCLCVSPQQELEYKGGDSNNLDLEQEPIHYDDFNDMFDDSIDDQLLSFSQKIEVELLSQKEVNTGGEEKKFMSTNVCDNSNMNNLISKYCEKKDTESNKAIRDNFLDVNDTKSMMHTSKHSKFPFQRTLSDNPVKKCENVIQTVSGKLEFHRTKSFELAGLNTQGNLTKITLEEIEKKRLEAKAKLESKRKKESVINKSPMKCSPEEIEKKRLQALAKLEAKRLQDIVEKKRQEALKKLQVNRMKNASQVRSTLTNRL